MRRFFFFLIATALGTWFFDRHLEAWLAPPSPVKIFIVEEDHTSISGQLNQAEYLLGLHLDEGMRDIVLEGYTGFATPTVHAPIWLPSLVHRSMLDYAFSSFTLFDYMPALATPNTVRRLSIALPELVTGNFTAAEFAGAVLPFRLHSGEAQDTYQSYSSYRGLLCEFLARKAFDSAGSAIGKTAAFTKAYSTALAAGSTTVNGQQRVAGEGQNVLAREFVRVLARSYRRFLVTAETCMRILGATA